MNWGWHWRRTDKGNTKVGIWFGGTLYSHKFYIPFPNQLWIK